MSRNEQNRVHVGNRWEIEGYKKGVCHPERWHTPSFIGSSIGLLMVSNTP